MTIDDGGNVHPVICGRDQTELTEYHPGMTLLDWFAGQALAGLIANPEGVPSIKDAAYLAFKLGGEMVAEKRRLEGEK